MRHREQSESEGHSVVSDSLWRHGLYSPWNSPGQNTGGGGLSLLQGIVPTQGSNPGLPNCRQILYQLSHKGCPGNRVVKGNTLHSPVNLSLFYSFMNEWQHHWKLAPDLVYWCDSLHYPTPPPYTFKISLAAEEIHWQTTTRKRISLNEVPEMQLLFLVSFCSASNSRLWENALSALHSVRVQDCSTRYDYLIQSGAVAAGREGAWGREGENEGNSEQRICFCFWNSQNHSHEWSTKHKIWGRGSC